MNPAVLERIGLAFDANRLHHALLLTGPAGSGKREAALWVARGLLCASGPRAGGCRSCGPCGRVDRNQHLDLAVVERPVGKTRIPVELVRSTIGDLGRGAIEGRGRVAILLDVELLNREGQNSLLKTLEEPAARTWLILTTSRPEALLDTVRSRVERIAIPPGPRQHTPDAALDRLAATLLTAGDTSGPAWSAEVLAAAEAAEAGTLRQSRIAAAARCLDHAVSVLREQGLGGDDRAWDAIENLLQARQDLDLGIGPRIILQDLHAALAGFRTNKT